MKTESLVPPRMGRVELGETHAMWIVGILHFCNLTAVKSNLMLLSLHSVELGADALTTGMLFACMAVAPVLLGLYAGRTSDRCGVRQPMLYGSAGVALALSLPYFAPGLAALFISATLVGAAYVFFHVAAQNMVGAISTAADRAQNFATYTLIASVGQFVGPIYTGIAIEQGGHATAYLALAVFPALATVVVLAAGHAFPRTASAPRGGDGRIRDLLQNKSLATVAVVSGLVLTCAELFLFYAPIHARRAGLSPTEIGFLLSTFALAAVAVRLVMQKLVNAFGGEERLLASALAFAAFGYLAFPFCIAEASLCFLAVLAGIGIGAAQPLAMTITYNYSPGGRSGEALGLRLFVNNGSKLALPVLIGAFGSVAGSAALLVTGCILAASASASIGAARGHAKTTAARHDELIPFAEPPR